MGLQENFRNERVDRLEIRNPVTMSSTGTVRDAMTMMRDSNIGCAIVIDDDRQPIGLFTESILTEILSRGSFDIDESIEKHMATRFPVVKITDPIADALEIMQLKSVRLLTVVDEQNRVVGLTGQRGLMEYVSDHFPGQVVVQRICQPPYYRSREGA